MQPKRKIVFAHNGPLYRGHDSGLYGTHITDSLRQRYLQLGDHVNFLMRERSLEGDGAGFSWLSPEAMSFTSIPEVLTPRSLIANRREAKCRIDEAVASCDILVARIPSLIGRWAVAAAKRYDKPYMVECVACNWDALSNHKLLARIAAPWYWYAQRRVIKQAPFVIYVTREFLQNRYPTKGRTLAISDVGLQPIDDSVLKMRLERIQDRSNNESIRLVTVASVSTPYKGQADVIAALKPLREAGIACEYHLVGGGDQLHLRHIAQKQGVEDSVIFHGAVRHADVFPLLDDMDIYVQPSRQEGLPRALIEAMSRGMPALGARTGGIPELLPPERIFAPGDTAGVVGILRDMRKDGQMALDAANNFNEATQYTAERLAEKRQEAYQTFLWINEFTRSDQS